MFWKKFYDLCIQNNTKPIPVVKTLGIATGTVTKWKNGSIPNGDTLLKIAEYFNVSVDYLLGRTDFSDEENETICSNIIPLLSPTDAYLNQTHKGPSYIPVDVILKIKAKTYKFTNEVLLQFSNFYDKPKEYFLISPFDNRLEKALYREIQDLSENEMNDVLSYIKSIKSKESTSTPEEEYSTLAAAFGGASQESKLKKEDFNALQDEFDNPFE